MCLSAVLLELPVSVVQRAHLSCLQPSGDAVEVECVIADAPCDGALLARGRSLICLTLDAEIHDVIAADGAVVDDNVPRPEGHGVPLLNLEALLVAAVCAGTGLGGLCLGGDDGRIGHVYVGHGGDGSRPGRGGGMRVAGSGELGDEGGYVQEVPVCGEAAGRRVEVQRRSEVQVSKGL